MFRPKNAVYVPRKRQRRDIRLRLSRKRVVRAYLHPNGSLSPERKLAKRVAISEGEVAISLKKLPDPPGKPPNSSRELGGLQKELGGLRKELGDSLPDLPDFLDELGNFFFRPSQGTFAQRPPCKKCLCLRRQTFRAKKSVWRPPFRLSWWSWCAFERHSPKVPCGRSLWYRLS